MTVFKNFCEKMEDKPIFKIHYDGNGCTLICTWRTNKEPKLDMKKYESVATQTTEKLDHNQNCPEKETETLDPTPEDNPKTKEDLLDTGKQHFLVPNKDFPLEEIEPISVPSVVTPVTATPNLLTANGIPFNERFPLPTPLPTPFNSFYHSSPFQRLIAMQSILHRTRY